jgi:hypothetical protein
MKEKLTMWIKASWSRREAIEKGEGTDGVEGLSDALKVAFEQGKRS